VETEFEQIGPRLPAVARQAIEAFVQGRSGPAPNPGPSAAVFVTLRRPDGSLRGCVGSTEPMTPSVIAETERSALLAASRDPRFSPVAEDEVAGLDIEVSVLMPTEPVQGLGDLDPARYGVIVSDPASGRRGLLLPGIGGIVDAATQVAVAKKKAGLAPEARVRLARFEVLKFLE
jgi:AmmeMemoRadiSam system protein A